MHWSVIEHLLLFALSQKPFTIGSLAQHARLPSSIVVESVMRLMRAGWIEILTDGGGTQLQASALGREEAQKDSLTPIARRFPRNLHFAIDRVTATVIGLDDVTLRHARDTVEQRRHCKTLHVAPDGEGRQLGYLELIDRLSAIPSLIRSDEKIVGCDPYRSSIESEWYLAMTVSGDAIEGLPAAPASCLLKGIRRAVAKLPSKKHASGEDAAATPSVEYSHRTHSISLSADDLLLGGNAHKDALRSAIANARRRVIVHSTFLSAAGLQRQLDVLAKAAERKVRIDLLWDRSDEDKHSKTLENCQSLLKRAKLTDFIRLSSFQTRSHSKLIIADDGAGGYFAIVGSCNWLSSPFKSYEVSVRLQSALVVSECLGFIEKMLPYDSCTGDLKEELISLGLRLRQAPSTSGLAKVRLLSQGDHETIIAQARDSARSSVFVASNKAGNTVETQVLAPFDSAAQHQPLHVSVYYQSERTDSALTPEVLDDLKRRYGRIHVETVKNAHAKLLCWDSDHAVVTSLNWLSKDASAANFVGECGIYIECRGIADLLRNSYLSHSLRARK